MTFQVGENVGPYQIVEQLGRGGMATVYKAYHPALDRYVAIKGMHVAFSQDPNFERRFQREARVVAKLEHPHIVPIYDYAEHDNQPYLVMKFIEGETLKARLSRGPLRQDEMLKAIDAIGSALDYAHRQGILHRDIKPSNVLVDSEGKYFLTDFGLARIAQAGESTLSADMMLGTPQYISPEQAIGSVELDEGTDIYSFGVMLYEFTVGQVPFSADTPYSIVHDHIYTPLPLPRQKKPDVPEPVERVLLKALAKKREDRYETVGQLVEAYTGALAGAPQPAPPASQEKPQPAPDPEELLPTIAVLSEGAAGTTPKGYEAVPTSGSVPRAPAADAAEAEETAVEPARKKRRWWLAVPAVLALCVCGFISFNVVGGILQAGADDPGQVAEVDEPEAEEIPVEPGQVDQPAEEGIPPEGDPAMEPAPPLEEAQTRVDENPEDPYAWLDLAAAHWAIDEIEPAMVMLQTAIDVGRGDVRFLLRASEFTASRDLWVPTVEILVIVVEIEGEVPDVAMERMERALFNASRDPYIMESGLAGPDSPLQSSRALIMQVARIRFELYNGDIETAAVMLDDFLIEHGDTYPPALMVEAELHYFYGDVNFAVELLEKVIAGEPRLSWVRQEAQKLLFEFNQ